MPACKSMTCVAASCVASYVVVTQNFQVMVPAGSYMMGMGEKMFDLKFKSKLVWSWLSAPTYLIDKHPVHAMSLTEIKWHYTILICLVDNGLDILSCIYDSIREIKHVSVSFFWMKILSVSCFVDQMADCSQLFSANNQRKMVISPHEISRVYGNGLDTLGSLVMCTRYTNKFIFGQLKATLGL